MPDRDVVDPPSPFVDDWIHRLSSVEGGTRRALDLAMGRGRHALLLAAAGWKTFGVDYRFDVVVDARRRARLAGLELSTWCADLTTAALPRRRFDVIVVTRYLQRDLCAAIVAALAAGGVLLYETFTELQHGRGRGPQSPDHLLKRGELRRLFADLDELFYEELTVFEEDALARLAARKRSKPS